MINSSNPTNLDNRKQVEKSWLDKEFSKDLKEDINYKELFFALLRRRKLFGLIFALYFLASTGISIFVFLTKPVYKGEFKLLVSDPINPSTQVGGIEGAQSLLLEAAGNAGSSEDIPTLIQFLKSPYVIEDLAKELDLNANTFSKRINIEQVRFQNKLSQVLEVSFKTNNPKEGLQILEKLSKTYLNSAIKQKQLALKEGIKFLDEQSPAIRERTIELSNKLSKFRQKYTTIKPEFEGEVLVSKRDRIMDELKDLENRRKDLIDSKKLIKEGKLSVEGFNRIIIDNNDQGGLRLRDKSDVLMGELSNLDEELSKARIKYSDKSKVIRAIIERQNVLRPLVLESQLYVVDNALTTNEDLIKANKKLLKGIDETFDRQPDLINEYNFLTQQLSLAREDLNSLEFARKNFQLNMAQSGAPWILISPPEISDKPIEPSIQKNISINILIAFLLASIAALVRDRSDNIFHNENEVRDSIKLPLLGHFPYVDIFKSIRQDKNNLFSLIDTKTEINPDVKADERKNIKYQRFYYQEALRNLFTSIKLLNVDNSLKALSLTSSIPAEGKSLILILLAKTLSEMGLKILLIDADMRKPEVNVRLGLNNIIGLSNLLTDNTLIRSKVIQKIKGFEKWDVITAGAKPPDAAKLLSSQKMKNLINEIKSSEEYDLILIDTPPVLGMADATLVSEHVDGVLLVVSLNFVDKRMPIESVNRITSTGSSISGLITNQIKDLSKFNQTVYGGYGTYVGYGAYADAYMDDDDDDVDDIEKEYETAESGLNTNQSILKIAKEKLSKEMVSIKSKLVKLLDWLDS